MRFMANMIFSKSQKSHKARNLCISLDYMVFTFTICILVPILTNVQWMALSRAELQLKSRKKWTLKILLSTQAWICAMFKTML